MSNEVNSIPCHYLATIKGACSTSKKWVHINLSKKSDGYAFVFKGKETLLSAEKTAKIVEDGKKYTKTGENFTFYELVNVHDSSKVELVARFAAKYNNKDFAIPIKQKELYDSGLKEATELFLGITVAAEPTEQAEAVIENEIIVADEPIAVVTPEEEPQKIVEDKKEQEQEDEQQIEQEQNSDEEEINIEQPEEVAEEPVNEVIEEEQEVCVDNELCEQQEDSAVVPAEDEVEKPANIPIESDEESINASAAAVPEEIPQDFEEEVEIIEEEESPVVKAPAEIPDEIPDMVPDCDQVENIDESSEECELRESNAGTRRGLDDESSSSEEQPNEDE